MPFNGKNCCRQTNNKPKKGDTAVVKDYTRERGKIIRFDEGAINDHLGEMLRSTVEETPNHLPDAEADRLCNAEKYRRSVARTDTRAGHYRRKLHTKAGEVTLQFPKLRRCTFETAIIELPSAGGVGRVSFDRDVPGGSFSTAG